MRPLYLYQELDAFKKYSDEIKIPHCIKDNLSPKYNMRPYQEEAFKNYMLYQKKWIQQGKTRNQVLFHMATGSGKTYIMAGLMLYLFEQGYRNFLFFVSLKNIVSKTKDNFLNPSSSKYLFSNRIIINGNNVPIREVSNFSDSRDDSINICFTTIQQLRSNYVDVSENVLGKDDFIDKKIVFISDESHHYNVDLKKKASSEIINERVSWQHVRNELFNLNRDNVLLEFTATCRLDDENIREEYLDKIIFNYDLKQFREEGYSKEVITMSSLNTPERMTMQALVLSQYRLSLFNDHHIDLKPIVLVKSKKDAESTQFRLKFEQFLENINGDELHSLYESDNDVVKQALDYFKKRDPSLELLAQSIKTSFDHEHSLEINQDTCSKRPMDLEYVTSIDEKGNPYRIIYAVDVLNEGWDALNLFDIVRSYDTRDARYGVAGTTTTSEAQLIGRGARYCPFVVDKNDQMYQRKYDEDLDNPLRVCETFYYHCHYNPRYIEELHNELVDMGVQSDDAITQTIFMKEEFIESDFYKHGLVYVNDYREIKRETVKTIPSEIRLKQYRYVVASSKTMAENIIVQDQSHMIESIHKIVTIGEIANINYNIVYSALKTYKTFDFNRMKSKFPNLKSIDEFITSSDYLADVEIELVLQTESITNSDYFDACKYVFNKISESLSDVKETYVGTKEFSGLKIKDVFRTKKTVQYHSKIKDGLGTPQIESSQFPINLANQDWYVYSENYGTSEEKGFVYYFYEHIGDLRKKYDAIYLVRNERMLKIYSFNEGRRFEPDFLLFLIDSKDGKETCLQVFIEPKGSQLFKEDSWKNDFLKDISVQAKLPFVTLLDDVKYRVIGLPFYNNEETGEFYIEFKNKILGEQ